MRLGIPRPGENTNRMLDFAIDRGKESLAAADARHINIIRPVVYGGWGTARCASMEASSRYFSKK